MSKPTPVFTGPKPSPATAAASASAPPAEQSRGGPPPNARGKPIMTIPSEQILQGSDAINIEHNGRVYQLRRTRQGKLILTK